MHQRLKIITLKSPQFNKKNVIQKFTLKFKVTIYKPVFLRCKFYLKRLFTPNNFTGTVQKSLLQPCFLLGP